MILNSVALPNFGLGSTMIRMFQACHYHAIVWKSLACEDWGAIDLSSYLHKAHHPLKLHHPSSLARSREYLSLPALKDSQFAAMICVTFISSSPEVAYISKSAHLKVFGTLGILVPHHNLSSLAAGMMESLFFGSQSTLCPLWSVGH